VEELEETETEERLPDENKECILIIDDNADVRGYVKSLLKEEYTVIEAADGHAGLKKAMKYVPDAIICDVMMPVMDGLECCRKLKMELQTSHIPVMFFG
jgi:CheY-like chemotaxis protein